MVGMIKRETLASHWWWFDSHNISKRSPWLESTIEELDDKTESMLKIIEQDADSFAQRAEMYYKKRPDLISMVEDFYRAHRSLAEKYDLLKSDSATRLRTSLGSPFSSTKLFQSDKSSYLTDQTYDSYSETYDPEESTESEVDDPDHEETIIANKECSDEEALIEVSYDEVNIIEKEKLKQKYEEKIDIMSYDEMSTLKEKVKRLEEENRNQKDQLRQRDEGMTELRRQLSFNVVGHNEVSKLKEEKKKLEEENRIQEDQLRQKDGEKIAAIRQLSFAVGMLKEENVNLRKCLVRDSPKKSSPFEFNKLKESLLGKLFNGSPRHRSTIIAL